MSEENNNNKDIDGFDPQDIEENKVISGLSYILFFLPLVVCPTSKFGKFHANQSLVLLITAICGNIAISILSSIFISISIALGLITTLLGLIFGIGILVFYILGLINGFNGRAKELPIIGRIKVIKY